MYYSHVQLTPSSEQMGSFSRGWDIETNDSRFIYRGRIIYSFTNYFVSVSDLVTGQTIYETYGFTPREVVRSAKHISEDAIALEALARIIPVVRQQALITLAQSQERLF